MPCVHNPTVKCLCLCTDCENHGKCCACVAYHRQRREVPSCYFSQAAQEKSHDRSFAALSREKNLDN